jgi:hypothetical protein
MNQTATTKTKVWNYENKISHGHLFMGTGTLAERAVDLQLLWNIGMTVFGEL